MAVEKQHSRSLSPTTTEQDDLTTAGQRRVNLIWEFTQAFIAIVVILCNMIVGVIYAINGRDEATYPLVLSSSLFLIVGFYFSRTNHQAIGGTGKKPTPQKYQGR